MNKNQLKSEQEAIRTMIIDVFKAFIYPLQGKYVDLFFTGYPERYCLGIPVLYCSNRTFRFIRFAEFKIQLFTSYLVHFSISLFSINTINIDFLRIN